MSKPEQTEDDRVTAMTVESVGTHIARLNALMEQYSIKKARQVINLDQSGICFRANGRRGKRKALGHKNKKLFKCLVKTKGIEHITVMSVVCADGGTFKPVIVYPGVRAHYRKVHGETETLHDHLMSCYLHHRDPAGVNSSIVVELASRRVLGESTLLVYDGYTCHIQYRILKMFKENNIYVVCLPAHLSHVLHPLDLTVFSSFKAHLERGIHSASRIVRSLDAFILARIIRDAYEESHVPRVIRSGFAKSGIWDYDISKASLEPLKKLPFYCATSVATSNDFLGNEVPTLEDVVRRFEGRARDLIRDVEIAEVSTVRVNTTRGAHLTSSVIIDSVREGEERRAAVAAANAARAEEAEDRANAANRLRILGPIRRVLRQRLQATRRARRMLAAQRTAFNGGFGSFLLQ